MRQFVLLLWYGADSKSGFRVVGPSDNPDKLDEVGEKQKTANRAGGFEIHELIPLSGIE